MDNFNKQPQELARLRREADWQAVLKTPEGLRVMGYLMRFTGHHNTSFGGADTHYTAFREGQRSVGHFIINQVRVASPEQLATIIMGGFNESGSISNDRHTGNNDTNDGNGE